MFLLCHSLTYALHHMKHAKLKHFKNCTHNRKHMKQIPTQSLHLRRLLIFAILSCENEIQRTLGNKH